MLPDGGYGSGLLMPAGAAGFLGPSPARPANKKMSRPDRRKGEEKVMKSRATVFALALAFLLAATSGAWADTPSITITPIPTQFWSGSNINTTISFTINHDDLKSLGQLNVKVDGEALFPQVNPFSNTNACTADLLSVSSACSTNSSDTANVSVPWTIMGVGNYTVTVSVRHSPNTEEVEEEVSVVLAAVEYPAPPAIANAFINRDATNKGLYGKKRGCIIAQIAHEHGKNQKYNAPPGPYNDTLVELDVVHFSGCK
jgi:hypothetical protein